MYRARFLVFSLLFLCAGSGWCSASDIIRFRGRIQHFEVWNEPNTGARGNLEQGFFRGSVSDYVSLLRVAKEVAREVDPGIRIVGCSGTGDFLSWTDRVLSAGGGAHMDILSFHAYTTPRSPEAANIGGRIERLKEIRASHGIAGISLWNTEVGYWTDRRRGARPATAGDLVGEAPPGIAPNWKTGWPYRPIPESEAAAYTLRHFLLNSAHGVKKVFWYSSTTSGFPLLTRDGGLRLSCGTVANGALQLAGASYLRRVDLGLGQLHVHLWQRGGEVLAFVWYAGLGSKDVEFHGSGGIRIFDMWGNPHSVAGVDPLTVEANGEVLTLVGAPSCFSRIRLRTRELTIPVDDCLVIREVNPDRPVTNHTSPAHHGNRRVFGLPDKGDALAWELKGIRPGLYDVLVELRTGSAGNLYGSLMIREAAEEARVRSLGRLGEIPRVIDGRLDEVEGFPGLRVSSRRQAAIGVADPFASTLEGDAWGGPEDLSAEWWCLAVGAGLYLAVDVTDGGGLFPSTRGAYNGDCIEVFLDLRGETDVGSPIVGEGVYQIMLRAPAGDTTDRAEHRVPEGVQAMGRRTEGGWAAEIFVPLESSSGRVIGLDIGVDDDDTGQGRKSQLMWHGTGDNFQDPSAYGRFVFP